MAILIYVIICAVSPVALLVVQLPLYGGTFLDLVDLAGMSVADFLGCFATAVSGVALIVPMVFRAFRGDGDAKRRLWYTSPVFGAALSGILSIALVPGDGSAAPMASILLGGLCVLASIAALVLYLYLEHKSWVPVGKE